MAKSHRSDGERIVLSVDQRYVAFLRMYFRGMRAGLLEDLQQHAEQLRNPAGDRAEAERLALWLADLREGQLAGSVAELESLLVEHLRLIDTYNEYERVTAEHQAFAQLLAQLPR